MIRLTLSGGAAVWLAPSAVAEIVEAGASSQWHGIKAVVRTFDRRILEVQERASDIAARVATGKESSNGET